MKPQCKHCKKFFKKKHGRNIHEYWCSANPVNKLHGAPPETKQDKASAILEASGILTID